VLLHNASGRAVTFFVSWNYAVGATIRTPGPLTPSRIETSGSYRGFDERGAIPYDGAGYVSGTAGPLGDCLPIEIEYGSGGSVTAHAQADNEPEPMSRSRREPTSCRSGPA
jgi:hypothetical protein